MIVRMNGKVLDTGVQPEAFEVIEIKKGDARFDKVLKHISTGLLVTSAITAIVLVVPHLIPAASAAVATHSVSHAIAAMAAPAAKSSTAIGLGKLITAYLGLVNYLAWGCFAFAGTAWLFGYRGMAVERIINASVGLLVILHSWDLVIFIRNLI
jgi:hypothetical protein